MFAVIRPEIGLTNIYPVIYLTIALNSIEEKTVPRYDITICTNLSINTMSFYVNTCAYLTN